MVSVVIPVFNKIEFTQRCLHSLFQNSVCLSQVTVIDNGSRDSTSDALRDWQDRFTKKGIRFQAVRNLENAGFGRACNQGIRLSTGKFIAIVNNDTWLMKEWDRALIAEIGSRALDEVGPFFDERPWAEDPDARARAFLEQNKDRFRTHFVPMLMFFTRRAVERLCFDHGGLFDERFFVTYEDNDLLQRMRILGIRYGQTSRCYIWHHSMGTRATPNLLPTGYEQEGLQLFIEKWGSYPIYESLSFCERWKRNRMKRRTRRGKF
jgi:GT2 family glycosyltransferase